MCCAPALPPHGITSGLPGSSRSRQCHKCLLGVKMGGLRLVRKCFFKDLRSFDLRNPCGTAWAMGKAPRAHTGDVWSWMLQ